MDENIRKDEEREDVTIINIGPDEKKTEGDTPIKETGNKSRDFSEEFSSAAKKAGDVLGTGVKKTSEFVKDLGPRTEGLRNSLKEKGFEITTHNLKGLINIALVLNLLTVILWFLPTLYVRYYGTREGFSGVRILREAGVLSSSGASQMGTTILFLMAVNFIVLILHIYLPGKKPAMALIYNIVFDIFYLIMILSLILSMKGNVYPGIFGIILIIVLIFSVYIQQKILKEQVIENYFMKK